MVVMVVSVIHAQEIIDMMCAPYCLFYFFPRDYTETYVCQHLNRYGMNVYKHNGLKLYMMEKQLKSICFNVCIIKYNRMMITFLSILLSVIVPSIIKLRQPSYHNDCPCHQNYFNKVRIQNLSVQISYGSCSSSWGMTNF